MDLIPEITPEIACLPASTTLSLAAENMLTDFATVSTIVSIFSLMIVETDLDFSSVLLSVFFLKAFLKKFINADKLSLANRLILSYHDDIFPKYPLNTPTMEFILLSITCLTLDLMSCFPNK